MRKNLAKFSSKFSGLSILPMAIIMSSMLVLTACAGEDSAPISGEVAGTAPGAATTTPTDGEIHPMVMAFMTWVLPTGTQQVQNAMNEILIPRYGMEVELLIMDIASYQQNMRLLLTAGEQVDILGTVSVGYVHLQQQGFLLDLEANNLLANFGPNIVEAVGGWEIVDGARIGGTLFGIPTNCDHASGRGGFVVGSQFLEGIGFPLPEPNNEVIHISLAEFENILVQLNAAFPELETIRPVIPGNFGHFFTVDFLGEQPFGVLMNPANDLTVTNFFESPEFYDFVSMTHRWNQAGFISGDAAADDTPVSALVMAGRLMSYFTAGKPGIVQQESNMTGMPVTVFQTGPDFMASNAAARFPWAIPITTASPERAMTLLNAMYSDAELANLLIWGIEGVHYEVQPSGHIDFPTGVDAQNSGWLNNVAWSLPNQFITHVWAGDDLDLYDQLRDFNASAQQSKAFGFLFDPSGVQNEIAAVTNAYDELIASLGLGMVEPSVGIATLNERLAAAGINRIIEEKQSQLDTWAAAVGIN
ncbi:MAG: ABC transporter substrate-binding protein [Defluviitaleaceae bacterium]|nr:ABC transporter substrate-binding protein [Defluviitaleaceae bacterium]